MACWGVKAVTAPLIFLDVETAGGDPRRHPIIQAAAIAVDPGLRVEAELEMKLQFDLRRANKSSLRGAHYQARLWREAAVSPLLGARQLARFVRAHAPRLGAAGPPFRGVQFVAHNAAFDSPFVQAWFRRQRVYLPVQVPWLCTLQRARWYFAERPQLPPPSSFRLAALCQYFEIPFHAADSHHALGDARAMLALYRRLAEHSENSFSKPAFQPQRQRFAPGPGRRYD